jgi:TPR repeat protein
MYGYCYYSGTGVKKNYKKAFALFEEAAEMGYSLGCYNLGDCYYEGNGVWKNYTKAYKWYKKAAEMDDPDGKRGLAQCYLLGKGVTKNVKRGTNLLIEAASEESVQAQMELAKLILKNGKTIDNLTKAYYWTSKALEKKDYEHYGDVLKLNNTLRSKLPANVLEDVKQQLLDESELSEEDRTIFTKFLDEVEKS